MKNRRTKRYPQIPAEWRKCPQALQDIADALYDAKATEAADNVMQILEDTERRFEAEPGFSKTFRWISWNMGPNRAQKRRLWRLSRAKS